jgi:hypothetical protein
MDDSKGDHPATGTRPGLIASGAQLSPPQEAWGAYVDHATHCTGCRSRDAGKCAEAETLYRAYQKADGEALRQYNRGGA